jgi:hypothetical protein
LIQASIHALTHALTHTSITSRSVHRADCVPRYARSDANAGNAPDLSEASPPAIKGHGFKASPAGIHMITTGGSTQFRQQRHLAGN